MRFINILLLTLWYVEGKGNERGVSAKVLRIRRFNYAEPIKLYTDKNICIGYYRYLAIWKSFIFFNENRKEDAKQYQQY